MAQPTPIALGARLYAWAIILAGLAVLFVSLYTLQGSRVDSVWYVLTALAAASGLALLRAHGLPLNFSVGASFTFAVLFLFGPAAAAVTSAVDSLSCNLRLPKLQPIQHMFNVAAPVLSIWLAGTIIFGGAALPLPGPHVSLLLSLAATMASVVLAWVIESALLAVVISLQRRNPIVNTWRTLFRGLWVNSAIGAYVGFLIAYFQHAHSLSVVFLLVPIPLMLYYGMRMWLGRLNDHVEHLSQTNRAYRAMVESFATAVDARDEVTHGHILRVQTYARALAIHAGITDSGTLEALDGAALLHDIGKLGIPDDILNKPGRLTPDEFEIMKTHVEIGTRILSGVEFPGPVLPIVRHHHENWNGTGYPDRVSGESIPIGARILMIVDCFDALVSDRPYRARMSTADAAAILRARRGNMYDPTLVDAFLQLLPALGVDLASAEASDGERPHHAQPVLAADGAECANRNVRKHSRAA